MSIARTCPTPVLKSPAATTGVIAAVVTGQLLFGGQLLSGGQPAGAVAAAACPEDTHWGIRSQVCVADTHW